MKVYDPIVESSEASLCIFNMDDSSLVKIVYKSISVLDALRYAKNHSAEISYPSNFGLVVGDFSFGWDDDTDGFVGYDESVPPAATLRDVVDGNPGPFNNSQIDTETWLYLRGDEMIATGPWPGGRDELED